MKIVWIDDFIAYLEERYPMLYRFSLSEVEEEVNKEGVKHTIDITKCKDCEHFMEFEKPLGKWQGLCHYYNAHSVMKNDFCSRGRVR